MNGTEKQEVRVGLNMHKEKEEKVNKRVSREHKYSFFPGPTFPFKDSILNLEAQSIKYFNIPV